VVQEPDGQACGDEGERAGDEVAHAGERTEVRGRSLACRWAVARRRSTADILQR
jgi:hypothetical protein